MNLEEWYSHDSLSAVDAKFEAQKLGFAPIAFQAVRGLLKFGILAYLQEKKEKGATKEEMVEHLSLSPYALGVLLEMGLSTDVIKCSVENENTSYILGKVGYFLLNDKMTQVNFDFVHDVCYKGMFHLLDSLTESKPVGLQEYGSWKTVYEGLSSLAPEVQKSWFNFDHHYSDGAFTAALKVVFQKPVKNLMDIGGNTGKWALSCVNYDPEVQLNLVDLPGQVQMAKKRVEEEGYSPRVSFYETNILDPKGKLPTGCDAVWMSQFLDCFSLDEITSIANKVSRFIEPESRVYVMEPLWDRQRYPAAAYSLHATSLYFSAIANGNSKMYAAGELIEAIEAGGLFLDEQFDDVGPFDYSILSFKRGEK